MKYYGWNPPFFGGQQNVLSRQAGDRIIKNDLLQLVRTSRGERVMRPTYGTILNQTVFEQFDDATVSRVVEDISRAIADNEPRVSVSVFAIRDEDNNQLIIKISGIYTNQENRVFEMEIKAPLVGASNA
jgi:hypothetical protein